MKLNLFFIAMDLLTLMIYPIVFAHGRLRRFAKGKERIELVNSLVPVLSTPNLL